MASIIPVSRVRAVSWRCRTPAGRSASIAGAAPGASMMASMAASPGLPPTAVSPARAAGQGDRAGFPAGIQVAAMSPSRWQQVIPAACRNTGRPVS